MRAYECSTSHGRGMYIMWGHGKANHKFVRASARMGTWSCALPARSPPAWLPVENSGENLRDTPHSLKDVFSSNNDLIRGIILAPRFY